MDRRKFRRVGFLDPNKPIRDFTKEELHNFLYKEPTKVKVQGVNLTYEGLIPKIQKSFLSKDPNRSSPTSGRSSSGRPPSPPAPIAAAPGSTKARAPRGSRA